VSLEGVLRISQVEFVKPENSTVTFKYDPFGRRIYKSSSAGTSVYAYDGDNLIEETNSSGAAVARYEDEYRATTAPVAFVSSIKLSPS
jgi:YD repeat-containing protein